MARKPTASDKPRTVTLRQFRLARDVDQAAMGALLGVSGQYYSMLERGFRKQPSVPVAVKIHQLTEGAVPITTWWPELAPLLK